MPQLISTTDLDVHSVCMLFTILGGSQLIMPYGVWVELIVCVGEEKKCMRM